MTTTAPNPPNRLRFALMLSALAGVLAYFAWRAPDLAPESPTQTASATDASSLVPAAASPAAGNQRQRAESSAPQPSGTTAVADQGLRGRVVDAAGRPVPGAVLYAVRASAADPFELAERAQRGLSEPPAAETRSGADGAFQLPLSSECVGLAWVVYALHPQFADGKQPTRKLTAGTWTDLGTLALSAGLEVTGTVIAEATGAAIAGAVVTLRPAAMVYAVSPVPGRERGLQATTDGVGAFRIPHVPQGSVALRAEADGFACAELPQLQLQTTEANEFHLALSPGGAIAGAVRDRTGRAVANAWVTAEALDLPNQPNQTARSSADGSFVLTGLGNGNYRLRAAALDFQAAALEPVALHGKDVVLVLEPQAAFWLVVLGSDGAPVTDYDLQLRRLDGEAPTQRGPRPPRRLHVAQSQLDQGRMRVRGLDPGEWQVTARALGHATSDALQVALDTSGLEPEVQLKLRQGGTVSGSVVDARGAPVANAIVKLESAGGGGSVAVFRSLLAAEPAPSSTTGSDGRFTCAHVPPGAYSLRIQHPGFAPLAEDRIVVVDGQTLQKDGLSLMAGAELSGTAQLDGQPLASGRVQLLVVDAKHTPTGFLAETRSDAQGRWRIPARLAPGRYVLLLNRPLPDNPFQESADQQASRTEVTVTAGGVQAVELKLSSPAPAPSNKTTGK